MSCAIDQFDIRPRQDAINVGELLLCGRGLVGYTLCRFVQVVTWFTTAKAISILLYPTSACGTVGYLGFDS
jgi:hypothetical protein